MEKFSKPLSFFSSLKPKQLFGDDKLFRVSEKLASGKLKTLEALERERVSPSLPLGFIWIQICPKFRLEVRLTLYATK